MSYLKYYEDENARHPVMHAAKCRPVEAEHALRRLWVHFATRKAPLFRLCFTRGNRRSVYKWSHVIILNTDHLNWLLVLHELAHALDRHRQRQGRRSSEHIWHGRHHAAWVDRLVAYVEAEGWHTGNLAHELALREGAQLEREREAAKPASPDERIEARRLQVLALEGKLRKLASKQKALETRRKRALRSLRTLERLHSST